MRHILKFSKIFHNVLSKLLDPQSWDLIHSAVCFIIHPFWHAFEVDILSLHTYVTNSIHSLGISKYQLTMYFLISGSFWCPVCVVHHLDKRPEIIGLLIPFRQILFIMSKEWSNSWNSKNWSWHDQQWNQGQDAWPQPETWQPHEVPPPKIRNPHLPCMMTICYMATSFTKPSSQRLGVEERTSVVLTHLQFP